MNVNINFGMSCTHMRGDVICGTLNLGMSCGTSKVGCHVGHEVG